MANQAPWLGIVNIPDLPYQSRFAIVLASAIQLINCLEWAASPPSRSHSLSISLHLLSAETYPISRSHVRPQKPLRHVLFRVIAGYLAAVQPDRPGLRSPAIPERGLDVEWVVPVRDAHVNASRLGIRVPMASQLGEARQR